MLCWLSWCQGKLLQSRWEPSLGGEGVRSDRDVVNNFVDSFSLAPWQWDSHPLQVFPVLLSRCGVHTNGDNSGGLDALGRDRWGWTLKLFPLSVSCAKCSIAALESRWEKWKFYIWQQFRSLLGWCGRGERHWLWHPELCLSLPHVAPAFHSPSGTVKEAEHSQSSQDLGCFPTQTGLAGAFLPWKWGFFKTQGGFFTKNWNFALLFLMFAGSGNKNSGGLGQGMVPQESWDSLGICILGEDLY